MMNNKLTDRIEEILKAKLSSAVTYSRSEILVFYREAVLEAKIEVKNEALLKILTDLPENCPSCGSRLGCNGSEIYCNEIGCNYIKKY